MSKGKLPTILITNDDSVYSKGICELIKVARGLGNVVVVAPDCVRSGMSGAITHKEHIRLTLLHEEEGFVVYSCSGTPVDCVKLALFSVFKDNKPDLLLSGINHGSNASVNAVYSATVAAAMEGCISNIPSIALSLCEFDEDADFSHTLPEIKKLVSHVLEHTLPHGTYLNVNFPGGELKGMKVCRQSDAFWDQEFDHISSYYGDSTFQLAGFYVCREPDAEDADYWALSHQYGSIVPQKIDMTDYDTLVNLKNILNG